MGDAIVADVGLTLAALVATVPESGRPAPEPNPGPGDLEIDRPAERLDASTARSAKRSPRTAIVVLESPSSTLALRNQLRLSRPGSYYFSAGGGLGFGLAAVDRRADGAARSARSSASSARARPSTRSRPSGAPSPTTCRSRSWSCATTSTRSSSGSPKLEGITGAPGLDLPELDVAAVAAGYGVSTTVASDRDGVAGALQAALASSKPELVEVPVAPGMSLF